MDKDQGFETGYGPCINDGCSNISKTITKPGLCVACKAREWYRKKNPDAQRMPLGHHGQWKGKTCSAKGCEEPAYAKGLCLKCGNKARHAKRKLEGTAYCPKKRSDAHLKMRYGITGVEYDRMFTEQGGRCSICKTPPNSANTPDTWKVRRLAVDHCHSTGKVRALLCNSCNLIVKDRNTVEILQQAIEYLKRHSG